MDDLVIDADVVVVTTPTSLHVGVVTDLLIDLGAINNAGSDRRMFNVASRDWPPAMILASSPCVSSRGNTSASAVGLA